MNLGTMIERTYDGLRDANREFITVEEVTAWLNEAQRDLSHRLKLLRKQLDGQVGAGGVIPLPADLIEAVHLRPGASDVIWRDDTDFFHHVDTFSTPFRGPYGRVFEGNFEIVPPPAENEDYELEYVYEPPDLVEVADVSPLPVELHPKMVFYARSQGFLRLNEMDHAATWDAKYEQGLPPHPSGKTRINPGPMNLTYEMGPFDTSDAGHR